jgi:hypothetical protein
MIFIYPFFREAAKVAIEKQIQVAGTGFFQQPGNIG